MNGLGQLTIYTLAADQQALTNAVNTYGSNSPQALALAQKLMNDQTAFATGNIPGTPGAALHSAMPAQIAQPSVLPYVIGGVVTAGVVGAVVWWLTR